MKYKIILEILDHNGIYKCEYINLDDLINVVISKSDETVYITTYRSDLMFAFLDVYSAESFFKALTMHRFNDHVIIKLGYNEHNRYILL